MCGILFGVEGWALVYVEEVPASGGILLEGVEWAVSLRDRMVLFICFVGELYVSSGVFVWVLAWLFFFCFSLVGFFFFAGGFVRGETAGGCSSVLPLVFFLHLSGALSEVLSASKFSSRLFLKLRLRLYRWGSVQCSV